MTAAEIYKTLGVSGEVLAYSEKILETLRPRFAEIDARAEINQAKVLAAMQKNRVNATHFAASTGYGYDDEGRDNLERVYAEPSTPRPRWIARRSPAAPMRSPSR